MHTQSNKHIFADFVPVLLHSFSCDLGTYARKYLQQMSKPEKLHLLTKHWKPSADYSFPVRKLNGKNRMFQSQWLDTYPWLVYSPSLDGCLCKHCMFFAPEERQGTFITCPYTNWTKALAQIKEHATCKYHQDALLKADKFVHNLQNPKSAIDARMDHDILRQIEVNRQVCDSLCARVCVRVLCMLACVWACVSCCAVPNHRYYYLCVCVEFY